MQSTADYSAALDRLEREITEADALVIGAGAGLSASAGLSYSGSRFENNFADFIARYQYKDMYSAGFYPYQSLEEHWAYWSRHIWLNRYAQDGGALYHELFALTQDKDYFVITTNVDHCFQKAGFDKRRLFYTQGDYGLFQCSEPCHKETYDNQEIVQRMVDEQTDMRIPANLIPRCPKCGKPMTANLRCDDTFVEDKGWHAAASRYEEFLMQRSGLHVLYLELGVGGNTPAIIKYPFWQMTSRNPQATYFCVNMGEAAAPKEIAGRSICIDEDIRKVIYALEQKRNQH